MSRKKEKKLPQKIQLWVDARKRFKISHAQIQMARELGLNPKKFGGLANHKQEPWKAPLAIFIEDLYFKRFGKERPEIVRSMEQLHQDKKKSKEEKRKARRDKEKPTAEETSDDPF